MHVADLHVALTLRRSPTRWATAAHQPTISRCSKSN